MESPVETFTGASRYKEENVSMVFHGTLMKTVVVFHWLRGRTNTSFSWPFSSENPGAILKDIPAHVTDVTTDS